MMKKKDGGTIKNWQMHDMKFTLEQIEELYPGESLKPRIMSGTVVEDPCGRWLPGDHMQSSLIVKLNRRTGVLETRNTIYKLQGEESIDTIVAAVESLGLKVTDIFY